MLHLLSELMYVQTMPLDVCYDEYLGKLPAKYHPQDKLHFRAVKAFRESLLQKRRGLPVAIISIDVSKPHVLLMDNPTSHRPFLEGLGDIIKSECGEQNRETPGIEELSLHYDSIMQLFVSRRERAAALCMLSCIFPANTLRNTLGLNEDLICKTKKIILNLSPEVSKRTEETTKSAVKKLTSLVEKLENEAKSDREHIERLSNFPSQDEENFAKFELRNKEERIAKIRKDMHHMAKKAAKREMKKWKEDLLSQKGKGTGNYQIDRGAEDAVYRALCEQLAAHDRRRGDPETGYFEGRKKKHSKDLQQIANKWLSEHGKQLIKSASTIRSWAAPRNKRYRSSKDHRGKGLWKFSRNPQKKYADRHINIHYNRAAVKNYTRFCFSKANKNFRQLVLRRAIDDKAYLRCGTSEGFSRPLHKPVTLSNPQLQKHLPAYDFPSEAGYVAPGVVQIIHDMEETDDKFEIKSNTIVVTCKPKYTYSSSATNWFNDMYAIRLMCPDKHELTDGREPAEGSEERNVQCQLIFLKDSLVQYNLMDIEEDYLRITEGEEFLEREVLRHQVLLARIGRVLEKIEGMQQYEEHVQPILALSTCLQEFLEVLPTLVSHDDTQESYSKVCSEIQNLLGYLKTAGLPRHRPVDIQTSDAGPGVGTSEKLVRIRNAEYFLINDLDMQCRFHYAPADSKMHSVERIMSTLNEAAGDGTFIDVKRPSFYQEIGEERLLQMSIDDFKDFEKERNNSIAEDCAQEVCDRYQGVRCMGTTIKACTPNNECRLFFDEKYMKKCSSASSTNMLESLPGSHYYQRIAKFVEDHYIIYDNGIEGIKDACKVNPCQYHPDPEVMDNSIERVPGPVPDYSNSEEFSYLNPQDLKSGNITPSHDINVDAIKCNERQPNDFCPRTQLHALMKSCGELDLTVSKHTNDDGSVSYTTKDANNTMEKVKEKLPDFIQKFCGSDLKNEVLDYVENEYVKKVKMATRKKENLQAREEEAAKGVEDIDWDNLIKTSSLNTLKVAQLDLYVMEIIGKSAAQVRKTGYLKADKIMDITAHFYSNRGKIFTREIGSTVNLTFDWNLLVSLWAFEIVLVYIGGGGHSYIRLTYKCHRTSQT